MSPRFVGQGVFVVDGPALQGTPTRKVRVDSRTEGILLKNLKRVVTRKDRENKGIN